MEPFKEKWWHHYWNTLNQTLILATHTNVFMLNMTTYTRKLNISRLERETYFSHTENHILALISPTNTKKKSAQKMELVGFVKTNNFIFTPYCTYQGVS